MIEIIRINTDVLIIGGGLAGLSAALQARQNGKNVVMVTKGKVGRSGNTIMARTHMAVVLANADPEDSIERHIEDTIAGGAYLNEPKLVHILAGEAQESIRWLVKQGVVFKEENGKVMVKGSPGHSRPRILTAAGFRKSDQTPGLAITWPLLEQLKRVNTRMLENVLIIHLLRKGDRVIGALGLDKGTDKVWVILAQAVIMAGGGVGRLYPLTTNTLDVTGDSYALAYQAGANLKDLEFIQFHPTYTVAIPKLVISTAPFADGAILRNRYGEAYMSKYSSKGNMATRDVMARANFQEIVEGRGSKQGGVYMDFTAVPVEVMQKNYPDIYTHLQGKTNVEVAPAQHFMAGGITIDEKCQCSIPGLYACGEAAGGVHGANRIAGNALTEAVVFGCLAGRQASKLNKEIPPFDFTDNDVMTFLANDKIIPLPLNHLEQDQITADPVLSEFKTNLRQTMGLHVGLVRSQASLAQARNDLESLQKQIASYPIKSYGQLLDYYQIKMMLTSASLIIEAAQRREESVGAHYRVD